MLARHSAVLCQVLRYHVSVQTTRGNYELHYEPGPDRPTLLPVGDIWYAKAYCVSFELSLEEP